MNEQTALTIAAPSDPEVAKLPPSLWQIATEAKGLIAAGLGPRDMSWQTLIQLAQHGRYYGLPISVATKAFYVVQGQIAATPAFKLAQAQKGGQMAGIKVIEMNERIATVAILRKGWAEWFTSTYTIEQARKMGLTTKTKRDEYNQWLKQPEIMLYWRAIDFALKSVFADSIFGLESPEDLGAAVSYSASGEVTHIEYPPAPTASATVTRPAESTVIDLEAEQEPTDDLALNEHRNALFSKWKAKGVTPPQIMELAKGWFEGIKSLSGLSAAEVDRRLMAHFNQAASQEPTEDPRVQSLIDSYSIDQAEALEWLNNAGVELLTDSTVEALNKVRAWLESVQNEAQ